MGEEEGTPQAPPPMTCPLGPDGRTPRMAGPHSAAHGGSSLFRLQMEFSKPLLPQPPRARNPSEILPGCGRRKTQAPPTVGFSPASCLSPPPPAQSSRWFITLPVRRKFPELQSWARALPSSPGPEGRSWHLWGGSELGRKGQLVISLKWSFSVGTSAHRPRNRP